MAQPLSKPTIVVGLVTLIAIGGLGLYLFAADANQLGSPSQRALTTSSSGLKTATIALKSRKVSKKADGPAGKAAQPSGANAGQTPGSKAAVLAVPTAISPPAVEPPPFPTTVDGKPPAPPAPPPTPRELTDLGMADKPIKSVWLQSWLKSYRNKHAINAPMPDKLTLKEIFPTQFAQRFGVPPETRILSIGGNPPGSVDALKRALEPNERDKWTVKLRLIAPDGSPTDVEFQVIKYLPIAPVAPTNAMPRASAPNAEQAQSK